MTGHPMARARSLTQFQKAFPDEASCAAFLFERRWPDGFVCPVCGNGYASGDTFNYPYVDGRLLARLLSDDSIGSLAIICPACVRGRRVIVGKDVDAAALERILDVLERR